MNNISIKYVTPSPDGTTAKIEYSVDFEGTGDTANGNLNVTSDELVTANQGAVAGDPYAGHKALIANKLTSEFTALNKSTEETNNG